MVDPFSICGAPNKFACKLLFCTSSAVVNLCLLMYIATKSCQHIYNIV